MTTEERMELGAKYKREMNCCQAVLKAMSDTVDMDEATLHRLAGGFGSGMGTMEGTCGALVGAIMVASLRASGGSRPSAVSAIAPAVSPATATGEAMKLSRQILPRFRELCGATICRELKGIGTGKVLCSCEDCVRNAVLAAGDIFK